MTYRCIGTRCKKGFAVVASGILLNSLSYAQLPAVPVPAENPITEEKRLLGKILFWDEQLSSDNTIACGSCHGPNLAGADPRLGSHPGADGVLGNADDVIGSPGVVRRDSTGEAIDDPIFGFEPQVTDRSAPNFFGALWSDTQFWDGRAEGQFIDPIDNSTVAIATGGSLEIQSLGPILSPVEMAKDGRTWTEVITKLELATPMVFASNLPTDISTGLGSNPDYPSLFQAAFGTTDITPTRIAFALATYERTLVADQTPFDLGALSVAQQNGLNAIAAVGPGGSSCLSCHGGATFTDNTFRNIGVRPPDEDLGRQNVSNIVADRGRFKVPTLRNTGVKTRFMHNGSLSTLAEVFAFYAPGNQNSADNLDPALPVAIPPPALANAIDFIANGLTDPRVAAGSFPFDAPTLSAAGAFDPSTNAVNVPILPLATLALGLAIATICRRQKIFYRPDD